MMSTPGIARSQPSTARCRRSCESTRKAWLPIAANPMSGDAPDRVPRIVGICFEKSFTYGTIGLMTTMNLAPRSTATSTFVVERMPPSMNWRPPISTGS